MSYDIFYWFLHPDLHTNQFLVNILNQQDMEMETDDPLPKPSTKRKPPKVEENCSKKEHVNVVFIGHVGM